MGFYENYISENYPTEADVETLLRRHGEILEEYYPNESLDNKVSHAKVIDYMTPERFVRAMKKEVSSDQLRELGGAYRKSRSPSALARYVAAKVKHSAEDLAAELNTMADDAVGALLSLSDIRKVVMKRERAEEKDSVAAQMTAQQGVFAAGEGPWVKSVKDKLGGLPIVVIKKGTDLRAEGLTQATRNGSRIQCFPVTDRGISVIKKSGGVRAWLEAHARHYLVRVEHGDISDFTGQSRWLAEHDKDFNMPWPPLADLNTIGVTVKPWIGLYLEQERFEVIDPTTLILKHFAEQAAGFGETGVQTVLKAPSEIAEAVRSTRELADSVRNAADSFLELIGQDKEKGDLDAVQVTFTPVGGTPLECEKTDRARFVVGGLPARGVRIDAIAEQVIDLLDS